MQNFKFFVQIQILSELIINNETNLSGASQLFQLKINNNCADHYQFLYQTAFQNLFPNIFYNYLEKAHHLISVALENKFLTGKLNVVQLQLLIVVFLFHVFYVKTEGCS